MITNYRLQKVQVFFVFKPFLAGFSVMFGNDVNYWNYECYVEALDSTLVQINEEAENHNRFFFWISDTVWSSSSAAV